MAKVLLLTEDAEEKALFDAALKRHKHEFKTFNNVEAASEELQKEKGKNEAYDMILCDIRMAQKLLSKMNVKRIFSPVILVSNTKSDRMIALMTEGQESPVVGALQKEDLAEEFQTILYKGIEAGWAKFGKPASTPGRP